MSRTVLSRVDQLRSWRGMPLRWERASSRVMCEVAHSSGRTKSSRRREERGVCHVRGLLELVVSSMRRDTTAAVKDFVVEPV